jgi:hypothetical protein
MGQTSDATVAMLLRGRAQVNGNHNREHASLKSSRGLVIVVPIGLFTVLALPMHAALRRQDIRVCGYGWEGCRTFEYSKAVRMTLIEGFRDRDGKLTLGPVLF